MGFDNGKKVDGVVAEAAIIASKTGSTPILWFRIQTEHGFIKFEQVISRATLDFVCEKVFWDCFGLKREKAKALMLSGDLSSLREVEVRITPEFHAGRTERESYWDVKYMNPRFFRPKTAPPDMLAHVASLFDAPHPSAHTQAASPRDAGQQAAQGHYGDGSAQDGSAWGYRDDDIPF